MQNKLSIYFIADPACCGGRDIAEVIDQAIKGGVTMVQYRDKNNPENTILNNAKKIKEIIKGRVPFLINDHVEIATQINADGAHIGQGDMSPQQARTILGTDKILGLTAFTEDHIRAIDPAIVDYIGTGPVFPTKTDKGKPVLGVERFAELIKLSPVPVVGIGGITPETAPSVISAGASGVAIMRAIGDAKKPMQAAGQFSA